ncbi:uncharacterized protein MELLADRAFT_109514 [Melampsora larici-populina 98AG31]|uniref:Uncharacterized protein n=1 Tax=Melampsora larici-populina (strain 98AG31 / pathotype 3-4-7) TaxID=747676 RepID=F4RWQ7_MELLP|nr:uncharacterized protein MELLADRAFT_109514 [Melampsora larici-populina 98AG31]EGG03188.1 hypothetical protein MELLADRAFT_109514 [Melampsora larici-populina 98AG31]
MADIGVRNPVIERLAERDVLRKNDDMYLDNPYAFTGKKCFIDPLDGSNWEGRASKWDDPSKSDAKDDKLEPSKSTQSVRSAMWAQTRSESHENAQAGRSTPVAYHPYAQPIAQPQSFMAHPQNDQNRGQGNYRGRNFIANFRATRGSRGRGGGKRGGAGGSKETDNPAQSGTGGQGGEQNPRQ